jgi:hypothetical protein
VSQIGLCWVQTSWTIPAWADDSWGITVATNLTGGRVPLKKFQRPIERRIVEPPPLKFRTTEEYNEMKLSQTLSLQLQKVQEDNKKLAEKAAEIVDLIKEANPDLPPPMDPKKKEELMRRLDMARQAKEERKQLEAEKARQRLKNLAKARRVKAKKRGN